MPWDPCYVIPVNLQHTKIGNSALAAKMVETFESRRLKAALYINAVLMGLGQD